MEDIFITMGQNVRRLRQNRGMSLSVLAERSQVAKGTLFRMEHGGGNPTVETVSSIARALNVPIEDIFRMEEEPTIKVVRPDEGRDVSDNIATGRVMFSTFLGPSSLDVQHLTFHKNVSTLSPSHGIASREYVLVLSGSIEIEVDDTAVVLGPGDFAVYSTDRPHGWRTKDEAAEVILLNTAPGDIPSYSDV